MPYQRGVLLIYTIVLVAVTFVVHRVDAAGTSPFSMRFEANVNGSILLRGNTNLVCMPTLACQNARNGVSPNGESLDNNAYSMIYADADGSLSTFNDSTATITMPPGSTVLFAGLYWGADTGGLGALSVADRDEVKLRTPSGAAWNAVTASTVHTSGTSRYQGFADVTALVAGGGSGVYGVADIQSGTGADKYAGWALAIAYQNPAEPVRALRVYDGLVTVNSGGGGVDVPVSGFQAPHTGAVGTEIGTVAYEGDLGKNGDSMLLNNAPLSDARNPSNNFFNSTASDNGVPIAGRDPGWPNMLGFDIDQFDGSNRLRNGATSATLTLRTNNDTYYTGVLTFAIDLYAPELVTSVTGTDVNGGSLVPGDVLEYRITVRNNGSDTADDTVVFDAIPAYTTYVPGSMRIDGVSGGTLNGGRAEFSVGSIPYQGSVTVTLQVRVDATTPAGYAITNLVTLSYSGRTTSVSVTGIAATSAVAVSAAQTDLSAALTVAPAAVQVASAPNAVTYTATVTNLGAALEPAASAELTLPAGVTAGPLPAGCTAFAQLVTCQFGSLLPGTRAAVAIPATAGAAATGQPVAGLVAYGAGADPVPSNDSALASFKANEAPRATADSADTTNGTAVGVRVRDNDTDPDGAVGDLVVAISTQPAHGTAVVQANGTVTYTPVLGWAGSDAFRYSITDPEGGADSATVTVRTANAAPVARDDAEATRSGDFVDVLVLDNDTDPNGDPLSLVSVSGPQAGAGTVTIAGAAVRYTPPLTFVGQAVIGYTVTDGTATATGQALVDVANIAPTAADDLAAAAYTGTVTIPVLANDSDINNDPLQVVGVDTPADGTATISGSTSIVYQAPAGFSGDVTFRYEIADVHGDRSTARITVTVANAPPVVAGLSRTTPYGIPVNVDVLAGATDPNPGDTLRVSGVTDPVHGSVVREPDGTLTYTPETRWSGPDSFTVTVTDDRGGTATATISVTVDNAPPVARPESVTLPAGLPAPIDVLLNDEDPNEDPLTVTVDVAPQHGTTTVSGGRVTYQPAPGYAGTDSFHYTASDGQGGTDGATVSIGLVNGAPVARADAAVTATNAAVTITVLDNDDDPNGDVPSLLEWTAAAHGTVSAGPGGTLVYTPVAGFTGVDAFGYTIEDPHQLAATATVAITVRNAVPVAADDAFPVKAQGPTVLPVLDNDTDPNTGQALAVADAGPAVRGTVALTEAGAVEYTPAPGMTGQDVFDYVLTDDLGGTDTGRVTITVDAAPVAVDDTVDTASGTPVVITAAANDLDPEGAGLVVSWAGTPANGTTTVQVTGTVRYTPRPGFAGTDIFQYVVRDPTGNAAQGTVAVRVANAAPEALPDAAAVQANRTVDVDVLANDRDVNPGQTLAIASVTTPSRGTATLVGGKVRYAAPARWSGEDQFRYVVSDDHGGTAESTVTVTVTNVIPFGVTDARYTPYGRPVSVPVLDNDLPAPGATLRVVSVTVPDRGAAVVTGPATVSYTPPSGFSGVATFSYTAADEDGNDTSATVSITVGPPPSAPDRAVTTPRGSPVDVALPVADELGRPFTIGRIGRPTHGAVALNPDGTITYTPDPGFVGVDEFSYEIVDADGNVAFGSVIVTVPAPASSPPVTPSASPSSSPSRPVAAPSSVPTTTAPVTSAPTPAPPSEPPAGALPTTGRDVTLVTAGSALAVVLGFLLYAVGRRRMTERADR